VLLACTLAAFSGPAARGHRSDRPPLAVHAAAEAPGAPGVGGPPACAWTPGFAGPALDGVVEALAVFDDGGGPALYAGGFFVTAGDTVAHGVARWDGMAWSALAGETGTGMSGTLSFVGPAVHALAVHDDGAGPALYAAGDFTVAGGVTAHGIAKWDGSGWSALSGPSGEGTTDLVLALAVYDDGDGPALYAGGYFTIAGGLLVNGVAKWDGAGWSALSGPAGTGVGGLREVWALAVYDDGAGPALYAGGRFTTAGGVLANGVAKWDGAGWSALSGPAGTGVSGTGGVRALAAYDDGGGPSLYASGLFASAGGLTVNNVARWDGTAWSTLAGPAGTGASSWVEALAVHDDGGGAALYAGGSFTTAGGVPMSGIARWDGGAWSALAGPAGNGVDGSVYALAVYDDGTGPALHAGGGFGVAGGQPASNLARWDGEWSAPSPLAGAGMDDGGGVYALAVYDDGGGTELYAGGWFLRAGGANVNRIARWDGKSWSALAGPAGTGVDGDVLALAVFDDGSGPALYAGGRFTTAGGVTVNHVARWDGTAWSPLAGPVAGPTGTGTVGDVFALAVFDDGTGPALYAGGDFTHAGGVPASRIAKWDGSAWSALSGPAGNGMSAEVFALTAFDDGGGPALYAAGSFAAAGGVTVNRIARWDGGAWSALVAPGGTGTSGAVTALAVYDDGGGVALYAGGYFATMGGVRVNNVAKWDGGAWSALSWRGGTGTLLPVLALGAYDDVGGPALYAGGEVLGGPPLDLLSRWDGDAWWELGGPLGGETSFEYGSVDAFAVYDAGDGPALFLGGSFQTAGGLPARNIARWFCTPQVFADGFESGSVSAWSGSAGGP
jgi:hypothetical protein